jgi:hypothetical protein
MVGKEEYRIRNVDCKKGRRLRYVWKRSGSSDVFNDRRADDSSMQSPNFGNDENMVSKSICNFSQGHFNAGISKPKAKQKRDQ